MIEEKVKRVNYFLDVDIVFPVHGHNVSTGQRGQSGVRA